MIHVEKSRSWRGRWVIYNRWVAHHPYPDKEYQLSGRLSPVAVGRRYVEGGKKETCGSFSHFSHT